MSIVLRGLKIVSKLTFLPKICDLKINESQYKSHPQLEAIKKMTEQKDPKPHEQERALTR